MRSDYPCIYMREDQRCCNQAIDGNSNKMRLRKKEFIANSHLSRISGSKRRVEAIGYIALFRSTAMIG